MKKVKTKKGAASFYVVAFSTLILLIIAASFTALVIAQVTRTSNADLSQSAYDSALAGVEDAKLAFYNYQNCLAQGAEAKQPDSDNTLTCDEIVYIMKNDKSCDMVAKVLGRIPYDPNAEEGQEVLIQESDTSGNNLSQAYTCVKVNMEPSDVRATLSSANQMKVTNVKFDDIEAKQIKYVKISWGVSASESQAQFANFGKDGENNPVVKFPSVTNLTNIANPPTLAVALLQAAETFTLNQFTEVNTAEQRTNRGMVYLVPTNDKTAAAGRNDDNYIGSYNDERAENLVGKNALVKSNDKTSKNLPYAVYCDSEEMESNEFACSAMIELPDPMGGDRGDDNFIIAVSLPYGKPDTDVSLEFFCAEGATCGTTATGESTSQAKSSVQVAVDSTGRANDLFRRVDTRLEGGEGGLLSVMGPLELFGDDDGNGLGSNSAVLTKNYAVTCEYNFEPKTCGQ